MANLFSGTIATDGEYVKVSDVTEIQFTPDTIYTIQIHNPARIRSACIREGTIGTGFYIFDDKPFQYKAGLEDLYIKTDGSFINIAD